MVSIAEYFNNNKYQGIEIMNAHAIKTNRIIGSCVTECHA